MKKTRLKRKSSSDIRKLIDKADRLLQDYYRTLALDCLVCGNRSDIVHHFVEKSQSAGLRYEPLNLCPLCRSCHARHHLAGDPEIVGTIIKKKGQAWYNKLIKLRLSTKGTSLDTAFVSKQIEKWTKLLQKKHTKGEKAL